MNELARLRGSERYGACDDVVQDALFLKGVCGAAPESTGFSRGSLTKGQTDKPERFIALPGYAARRRQGQRP